MSLTAEIIIVSYQRLSILERTLDRVRALYPNTLLCVGLQGEGRDAEFLQRHGRDSTFRLLHLKRPGIARTLNACVTSSQADLAFLLDDDAVPCPGWLESYLKVFETDSTLAYATGREIRLRYGITAASICARLLAECIFAAGIPREAKLLGRPAAWATRTGFVFGNFDLPGTAKVNSARGCNMALRRSVFLEHGGFDENFRGNSWGFETEFGLRLQEVGLLGRYLGDAMVLHEEASSGGTRSDLGRTYLEDFRHNQKLLRSRLGWASFPGCWLREWRVRKNASNWGNRATDEEKRYQAKK